MNVKAIGLVAALTLGGVAGAVEAQRAQPGSANTGGKVVILRELKGKVLGIQGDTVYIVERSGAAVPIKATAVTALDDALLDRNIERQLKQDLTEGQQVRATYGVQGLQNVAVSIESGRK